MADNTIAIAMEDGTINLYPLKDTATRKFIEEPKKLATLSAPTKIAGPGGPAMSTSLSSRGVEKRPFPTPRQAIALDLTANGPSSSSSQSSSQRLLAQIQDAIYVWDVNRPEAPIQTLKTTVVTAKAARWCPLSHGHQHISRGSTSGAVKIYDLKARDPSVPVWAVKKGHSGVVRDISWNPFIPYWFATAGSDGIIQVWDTRFGAQPVRTLADHSNAVNSISWSPTNTDMLASGGADRRFKMWNLRVEPHYMVSSLGLWDASVIGVGWTQTRPNSSVFGVSATGIVQACLPNSDFLLPMVPSLDDQPQKDAIKKVERSIYNRNFADGFQKAFQLATQYLAENKISQANKLLNICYQRPEVVEPAFLKEKTAGSAGINVSVASNVQKPVIQVSGSAAALAASEPVPKPSIDMHARISLEQFEKDLDFYSYYIPPNYPDHLWPPVDQKLMFAIEALKMSLDLEQMIRDENALELIKIVPDVADFMKRDQTSLDIPLLFRLFSVLLPADFLSALELGHQLARVFVRTPAHFYGIANMIMFPTIYDTNWSRESVYGEALNGGKVTSKKDSVNNSASSVASDASKASSSSNTSSTNNSAANASSSGGTASGNASKTSGGTSAAVVVNAVVGTSSDLGPIPLGLSNAVSGLLSHKLYTGIQNAASSLNTEITSSFLGDQLEFNFKFYKTLWGNNSKDILEIFDANTVCLSATTWRIYLNMLTLHRQYDKLFIRGSRLGEKVKGFPFADVLAQLLAEVVPRLQKYLRDATSLGMSIAGGANATRNSRDTHDYGDSTESESVQAVNRLGRAGALVLNILHNSDARYLPKTLTATLPGALHQLTVDLETSIREVVDEDNCLDDSEKFVRVSAALKRLSSSMTSVLGKREPAGQFMDAINEYRTMIDNNARNYSVSATPGGSTGANSASGGTAAPPAPQTNKRASAAPSSFRSRLSSISGTDSPRVKKDTPSPEPKK